MQKGGTEKHTFFTESMNNQNAGLFIKDILNFSRLCHLSNFLILFPMFQDFMICLPFFKIYPKCQFY